ncbi:unnamed protein product [Closterium sp. Naga37s-1]|nr:unnamed protein product [Closterium sp. Naga37s-1]
MSKHHYRAIRSFLPTATAVGKRLLRQTSQEIVLGGSIGIPLPETSSLVPRINTITQSSLGALHPNGPAISATSSAVSASSGAPLAALSSAESNSRSNYDYSCSPSLPVSSYSPTRAAANGTTIGDQPRSSEPPMPAVLPVFGVARRYFSGPSPLSKGIPGSWSNSGPAFPVKCAFPAAFPAAVSAADAAPQRGVLLRSGSSSATCGDLNGGFLQHDWMQRAAWLATAGDADNGADDAAAADVAERDYSGQRDDEIGDGEKCTATADGDSALDVPNRTTNAAGWLDDRDCMAAESWVNDSRRSLDEVWMDSARSRIRDAALQLVEAQQAALEHSRVASAMEATMLERQKSLGRQTSLGRSPGGSGKGEKVRKSVLSWLPPTNDVEGALAARSARVPSVTTTASTAMLSAFTEASHFSTPPSPRALAPSPGILLPANYWQRRAVTCQAVVVAAADGRRTCPAPPAILEAPKKPFPPASYWQRRAVVCEAVVVAAADGAPTLPVCELPAMLLKSKASFVFPFVSSSSKFHPAFVTAFRFLHHVSTRLKARLDPLSMRYQSRGPLRVSSRQGQHPISPPLSMCFPPLPCVSPSPFRFPPSSMRFPLSSIHFPSSSLRFLPLPFVSPSLPCVPPSPLRFPFSPLCFPLSPLCFPLSPLCFPLSPLRFPLRFPPDPCLSPSPPCVPPFSLVFPPSPAFLPSSLRFPPLPCVPPPLPCASPRLHFHPTVSPSSLRFPSSSLRSPPLPCVFLTLPCVPPLSSLRFPPSFPRSPSPPFPIPPPRLLAHFRCAHSSLPHFPHAHSPAPAPPSPALRSPASPSPTLPSPTPLLHTPLSRIPTSRTPPASSRQWTIRPSSPVWTTSTRPEAR